MTKKLVEEIELTCADKFYDFLEVSYDDTNDSLTLTTYCEHDEGMVVLNCINAIKLRNFLNDKFPKRSK